MRYNINMKEDKETTGRMSEEEWARVQGMGHNEFQKPTKFKDFFDDADKKLKERKDNENI
jgi:hypothetical protein